ncbi:helix-turn-helix transcriptional regulator [Pseudonocardia sp. HH130630-07]|uniref:helix-turn-helix transcriptional regulator n=1 Tax=Pseudonocardia sp. HH130630-07 TaxID=1690815 RepID=UPI003FA6B3A7
MARVLLEQGPVPAAVVAGELGLTEAAVRRHLDALIADGEAAVRAPARSTRPRGRGRPAREYLLTDAGRVRFGHGYDDLATSALRFLAETAGEAAVDAFARRRVHDLLGAEMAAVVSAGDPQDRAEALASVLSSRGYAAQTRRGGFGVQLCQHHCPVAHVATEFPELCEAETRAFADLLGTHVQRLATIARGDAACTTHVPLEDPELLGRVRQGGGRIEVPASRNGIEHPGHRLQRENVPRPEAPPPKLRSSETNGTPSSRTVGQQPPPKLRKMQEEDGPAEGGTISHHGPRKGGSTR